MPSDLASLLKAPQNKAEKTARLLIFAIVVMMIGSMGWQFYDLFVVAIRGKAEPKSWSSILSEIGTVAMFLSLALSFSSRPWRRFWRPLFYLALGFNILHSLWPRLSEGGWQCLSALSPYFSSLGLMLLLMAFMPPQFRPKRLASKPALIGVALALIILPIAVSLLINQEASSRNMDLSSQLTFVLLFIGVGLLVVAGLPPQYTTKWRVPRPVSVFAGVVILALAIVLPEFMLGHASSGRSSRSAFPRGAASAPEITPLEKVKEQNQIQLKESDLNEK